MHDIRTLLFWKKTLAKSHQICHIRLSPIARVFKRRKTSKTISPVVCMMGACEDDFFVCFCLQEPYPRAPACPSSPPPPPPPVLPAHTGTRYSSYYPPGRHCAWWFWGGLRPQFFEPVMWIRDGYNPDPDPAFFLAADPDPGSQINAETSGSGSWSNFPVTKSWIFTWKIYLK